MNMLQNHLERQYSAAIAMTRSLFQKIVKLDS